MFSIPLRISGVDEEGKPFEVTARTINLNLHGASIQGALPLKTGQTIRVTNQVSGAEDEFRVVGPISPPLDRVGEWGIECLHIDKNIWASIFPLPTSIRILMFCSDAGVATLWRCNRSRL